MPPSQPNGPSAPHEPRGPGGPVWFALGGFIAVCFAVAAIGGAIIANSVGTWYQTINKPGFIPPDWVFAPVWNALYMMMALAAFLVWRQGASEERFEEQRTALYLFSVQLVLNLLWSFIFFGAHAIGAAFIEIIALWIAIALTTVHFWKIDRRAGLLFLPYLVWAGYATVLNGTIWWLN